MVTKITKILLLSQKLSIFVNYYTPKENVNGQTNKIYAEV